MSNIKVKTIDDLTKLNLDTGRDDTTVKGSDVFVVSHETNNNDLTQQALSYARGITLETIRQYIVNDILKNQLTNINIQNLGDGEEFMESIDESINNIKMTQ
jgi:hypothetical protein